jgi:hypothetical protein
MAIAWCSIDKCFCSNYLRRLALIPHPIRRNDISQAWHTSCHSILMVIIMTSREVSVNERAAKGKPGSLVQSKFWLGLVICAFVSLFLPLAASAAMEESFAVLEVGPKTYKNVTVTKKAKDYILISHQDGIMSVKVADLPGEVKTNLGYVDTANQKSKAAQASAWVNQTVNQMGGEQIKEVLNDKVPAAVANLKANPRTLYMALGVFAAAYLFICYCWMLICQKAGVKPGVLVWIPVLQWIPMFKAASMSPAWLIGLFLPVVNIVAWIMWCFKIARARGKSAFTGILLLLPVTNFFAILYLAFSDGDSSESDSRDKRIEVMTLETA